MREPGAAHSESVVRRLSSARRRAFVGRGPELELFAAALREPELPFVVLHVHGPGGIGKSTLLEAYAELASRSGHEVARIDGREVEPSPEGFRRALAAAPAEDGATRIVLVDSYDALAPIDGWIRDELAPSLTRTLLVLAGREPPSAGWREDAGWRELARAVALRNLAPDEARAFLDRRGVQRAWFPEALAFTHGHPLALALAADVLGQGGAGDAGLTAERSLDIIRVLVLRFTGGVPTAAHREALEVCAHARATTEPLLAAGLGREDVHGMFEWLRGLSFIECTPAGLQPHDLAREALDADLRWRNPEAYQSLHRRVRAQLVGRMLSAQGLEAQRAFHDVLFLHRNHPAARPIFVWSELGRRTAEPAGAADRGTIADLLRRHVGPERAGRVSRWLERQPHGAFVYRDGARAVSASMLGLDLGGASDEERSADPVARMAWEHLRRTAPLRRGETADLARAWVDAERGTAVPCLGSELAALVSVRGWLSRPGLAVSYVAADSQLWGDFLEHLTFERVPGEVVEDGVPLVLFAHDWRRLPVPAWLEVMGDREIEMRGSELAPTSPHPEPMVVLSHPEFAEAVRLALRDCSSPEALRASVLLRSRLVLERAGLGPAVPALQGLLREAAAALGSDPRKEKLHRAVHRTFIDPAPTQERAAELLRLPFGTYRRHLQAGIDALVAWLWERELHGSDLGPAEA